MATHLKNLDCGSRTYYLSHTGEDVYYSTEGRGRGTSSLSRLKFKKNEILKTATGNAATDFEICQMIKSK